MNHQEDRPVYQLLLRPELGTVPEIHRLKRCLKALLRCYGLRCVDLREVQDPAPATVKEMPPPDRN